jgi:hypothetical protein
MHIITIRNLWGDTLTNSFIALHLAADFIEGLVLLGYSKVPCTSTTALQPLQFTHVFEE